ncbi:MAG: hypothetical protein K6E67_04130 [Prevotella sp.]|jgi:hypothetical protein|nr:hypothetical protein [Prevotella sp.]
MEEIKITVSIKRLIIVFLITAAYIAVMLGIFIAGSDHKVLETIIHFVGLMVLYCLYFFYLGRWTRLVITDMSLIVKTQEEWVVRLSGVESFYIDKYQGRTFIGIRYKEDTWEAHKENIAEDCKRRSRAALQGYPYEVYVSGLSMKPQEICDLLNSRINK